MSDAAEADLMETERRWVQAHRDLNLAEIEDILDAGYKRIVGDRVINKEDLLASYRSGKRRWDLAEGSEYSIQVHGSFAIVVGTWRSAGVNHGERFDYRARFLALYVRRPNGWKLYRDETFEL